MASIHLFIQVPEVSRDFFKTSELDPFTEVFVPLKVDTDTLTILLQQVLQEARYQKQRDEKTFNEMHRGGVRDSI